jgi:F-type H+-transporting ATPase subunit alpha
MEDIVMAIFAADRGFLDNVPVPHISAAEEDLLRFMREQRSEIGTKIAETGDLDDETVEALKAALTDWKQQYQIPGE